jgi:hypothetical protein
MAAKVKIKDLDKACAETRKIIYDLAQLVATSCQKFRQRKPRSSTKVEAGNWIRRQFWVAIG